MEKMLAMPTENFNVSYIEELASSIEITYNGDPQHAQNSKKYKRIQMCL